MNLTGAKVRVKNITRADVSLLVKWKNDPEIGDLVRGGSINTTFEIESRRFERGLSESDIIRLMIETLAGKPIGFISLVEIDKDNKKAEIGMLIGEKDYWDNGYGTDALVTLLRHLFFEMDFNRIGLEVFEYNQRAKKAYEKIGFIIEGMQRQGLCRNNKYHDIYLMGITKEDFVKIHGIPHPKVSDYFNIKY